MDVDFMIKPKLETSVDQSFDEFGSVFEEKPVMYQNETDKQNKCIDNTIKEEIENIKEDKECKLLVKGETIDDIVHEDEEQYQKILECEELIIKYEENDLDEPDYVDICSECTVIVAVNDNPVLMGTADRVAQTVPKGTLALRSSDVHGLGIYSQRHLKKGVRLGPYEGNTINVESTSGYSWKLRGGRLVDISDETYSNYLRHVNPARDLSEQNLVAFQCNGKLYYRTCRDVEKDEELLIYFDDNPNEHYYDPNEENREEEFYTCQFCQLGFKFETHRDIHQMFCKTRTDNSYVGSLCRHYNHKRDEEETQIEPVESTRKYVPESFIHDTNQKLTNQQKNIPLTDKTYSKYLLKQHEQKQEPTKMFKCSDCDYKTCYKSNLNKHKHYKHDPTKTFKCTDCNFETRYKYNLDQHRQQHEVNKIFKCADCDYKTCCKHYLSKHRRKHVVTNLLKCADCDFATYYKSNLIQHRQKHEPTEMFQCAHCDYETCYKSSLVHHMNKHDPNKIFKCSDCYYETHYKYNLNQHRQKHELNKRFKCADCDYETIYKKSLNKHGRKHKPSKIC